jgi:hypothetical protein
LPASSDDGALSSRERGGERVQPIAEPAPLLEQPLRLELVAPAAAIEEAIAGRAEALPEGLALRARQRAASFQAA